MMFNNMNFLHPFLYNSEASLGIAGLILGIIIVLLIAFWIWMLVHAITHNIEYKPVWILVIWIMNIVGAIVYYFAVKKNCDCEKCQAPNSTIIGEIDEIDFIKNK